MVATRYVLGFMFNADLTEVVLIHKSRPTWQAGLLNGIGGHIEMGESQLAAMVREFEEETGCRTLQENWQWCLQMNRKTPPEFSVDVFRCIADEAVLHGVVRTNEDQPVEIVQVRGIPQMACVSNLVWLVEMLADLNPGDCPSYGVIASVGQHRATMPSFSSASSATSAVKNSGK
jgi:8-oxo-dGTP diphosphatase